VQTEAENSGCQQADQDEGKGCFPSLARMPNERKVEEKSETEPMSEKLCINPSCGHNEAAHRPEYKDLPDRQGEDGGSRKILLRRCSAAGCDCEEFRGPKEIEEWP
jgi:hypothetical protein